MFRGVQTILSYHRLGFPKGRPERRSWVWVVYKRNQKGTSQDVKK
jgi:hypothetical protein